MTENIVKDQSKDNEIHIRPSILDEFVGQEAIKSNLKIFISAARQRAKTLDHVLFYGPPGLGKTTLAGIISKEMGVNFRSTSGPVLNKGADLAAILTNLQEGDVLFIDEIHRLNINVEEMLYSGMEDYSLDIIIGEGPSARTVKISLPKFTLIGATTRIGLLTNPLRDRFGIPLRLSFYTIDELVQVVLRAATILDVKINQEGAKEIATRARGTPRIALRLLKRVSDFAVYDRIEEINASLADKALNLLEVDKLGLDSNDYRYLRFIVDNYNGGPVGIETIGAGLQEQRDTIEDTIEPYLIQIGFLQRTPRGRVLTDRAVKYCL
ncbi:MAG: Holliday junction branch migration DNA helicase RuvB [Rickettsiaceae bacterium]|nr:Holliday junction branch migration DNA helicase RuvB [Rickettsiaceae bacterium]